MKKEIREKTITEFAEEFHDAIEIGETSSQKLKFLNNKFSETLENLIEKYSDVKKPKIISSIKNFYETASLAGSFNSIDNKSGKPSIIFIDENSDKTKLAMFYTLLMKICKTKEGYLSLLLGLSNEEVLEAIAPKELKKYQNDELSGQEYIDIIRSKFNYKRLQDYLNDKYDYDPSRHFEMILNRAKKGLNKQIFEEFKELTEFAIDYFNYDNNYHSLANELLSSIRTEENHLLRNDNYYSGYQKLITKNGTGNIKHLTNIDLTTKKGVLSLETTLLESGLLSQTNKRHSFDIAVIPNLLKLPKETILLMKKLSQEYVIDFKDEWYSNNTSTLHVDSHKNMGAQFIVDERENRQPLTNLTEIKCPKGIPFVAFISGAEHGNIYHSEVDTQNMIDIAIANNVKTIYIKGLFYSTYYRIQTSRRMLSDPDYPTLDSRLKKAKEVIQQINDAGIKVEYIMGAEEESLFEDLKRLYLKEQGVKYWDFISRDDVKVRYSWVEPFIIQHVIPYMIRSGEDVVNFHTDEELETKVSAICHALKTYYDGYPLGNQAKYINPKYLEDTPMFKVSHSSLTNYHKNDPALSVQVIEEPNFSSTTQYSLPTKGAQKQIARFQTGTVGDGKVENLPQLIADLHQGYMHLELKGGQVLVHNPQMINDEWYDVQSLLPGIKNKVNADPTKRRVTQGSKKPNYPGGWIVGGDAREWLKVIPYFKRTKEVMNYVQETGKGLPETGVLYINDTQLGSITERIEYFLKIVDIAFYLFKAKGITFNGDFQQGWNYPSFPVENRHLGSANVSQQMMDFVELIRPWMNDGMGVVNPDTFEVNKKRKKLFIDSNTANEIINHLEKHNLIEKRKNKNFYGVLHGIKNDINYKTVDLKLPPKLISYESYIREQLDKINYLEFIDIAEGNHEYNTDWNKKGYRLVGHLKQEFELLKNLTGSNIDIVETEFLVNQKGDYVQAPFGFRTINGYNTVYGHSYRGGGKQGNSPVLGMAKYFEKLGELSSGIHRALGAHYHIIEMGVINNKLYNITGGFAGQSGFEHSLGLHSDPAGQIDVYLPDGRIEMNIIGKDFIKNWKIKNPHVASMGLEKFIQECFTEYAPIYGEEIPKEIQDLYQRTLKPAKTLNKTIGPKIK